jgi:hypothetical protein
LSENGDVLARMKEDILSSKKTLAEARDLACVINRVDFSKGQICGVSKEKA